MENYNHKEFKGGCFGWLANYLPDYEFSNAIPTDVFIDNKIGRPFIYPHEGYDHPFVKDFYQGILKEEEAERRINFVLNK